MYDGLYVMYCHNRRIKLASLVCDNRTETTAAAATAMRKKQMKRETSMKEDEREKTNEKICQKCENTFDKFQLIPVCTTWYNA